MIRVGIVGTNTSHAGVFAGLINGRDGAPPVVDGARVVAVWSSGEEGLSGRHSDAATLAADFGIDTVSSSPDQMINEVDLVLVLDDLDGGALHPELAAPFLEAGVPTYVDKPMALTVAEALRVFDLAEQRATPLMSCSALRFASALEIVGRQAIGNLSMLVSVGPGDWYNYGIHAVEAAVAVAGSGATWVQQSASDGRDVTLIGGDDGPRIMIGTLRDAQTGFQLTAYGDRGRAETVVDDFQDFYANTITAAVGMAASGRSPVDRRDTLEVLAILAAGQRSADSGDRVLIEEVLDEARQVG